MTIVNDKLYYYGNEFSYITHSYTKTFGIIDVKTEQIISKNIVDPNYVANIKTPYGIAVNPITEDIYLTDAGNYVSTGYLYCLIKMEPLNGKQKPEISQHTLLFFIKNKIHYHENNYFKINYFSFHIS